MERRKTRQIQLGNVKIGGGAPVAVQSMTNTHTDDAAATLAQIGHGAGAYLVCRSRLRYCALCSA